MKDMKLGLGRTAMSNRLTPVCATNASISISKPSGHWPRPTWSSATGNTTTTTTDATPPWLPTTNALALPTRAPSSGVLAWRAVKSI